MSERLEGAIAAVGAPDAEVGRAVQARLDLKTKPRGSLGGLERLAVRIASIQRSEAPSLGRPVVIVCAADHGVAAEGVSAFPSSVTAQMVANYAAGGAAVSVLARHAGAGLVVVDCGVAEPLPVPGVLDRRIAAGTASMLAGPAMTREQAIQSLAAGIALADEQLGEAGVVALGEMGIGNSTAAAALTCALTGADPALACGRGTGLDDEGLARKIDVVTRALAANGLAARRTSGVWPATCGSDPGVAGLTPEIAERPDPIAVLAAVGGFELGVLAGLAIGAAGRHIPVLVDGYPASAAVLVAAALAPELPHSLIAAHRSSEPGHRIVLEALGLHPLLDLELRLGEGSGAALALPLLGAALKILDEMATFESAGVDDSGR
jgi:nicotinate-nucleotide--dimethylbenzimidazole phosphoribosyltransferase